MKFDDIFALFISCQFRFVNNTLCLETKFMWLQRFWSISNNRMKNETNAIFMRKMYFILHGDGLCVGVFIDVTWFNEQWKSGTHFNNNERKLLPEYCHIFLRLNAIFDHMESNECKIVTETQWHADCCVFISIKWFAFV